MKEMLIDIVASIVTKPSEIKVTEKINDNGTIILELSVSKEDMGKVIGRKGKIANAIRTLVKAAAIKSEKKVTVEII